MSQIITPDRYLQLWSMAVITEPETVQKEAAKLAANKSRYEAVCANTAIPWQVVAVIHARESGSSFLTHLHNGDPLSAKTVHVPKGRPKEGNPPYKWEYSAHDALINLKGMDLIKEWPIETILAQLEAYNGWGYAKYHPEVNTPYLWSKTSNYTKGKYTYDGSFNAEAIDKQTGAAALLKYLL